MRHFRSLNKYVLTLAALGLVMVAATACSPNQNAAANQQTATSALHDGHDHGPSEVHNGDEDHTIKPEDAISCETACAVDHGTHGPEDAEDHAAHMKSMEACGDAHGGVDEHGCEDGHAAEGATGHEDHEAEGDTGHEGHDHAEGDEEDHVDEVTLTLEAIKKNGIRVEPARRQAMDERFTVPGRVSYNTEAMAHIGTTIEGRVAELKVKLGDMVDNGDVLMVIDSPILGEAQSTYLQKLTDVDVARSALEVSRTSFERAGRLYEGQGISLGEYQKREGEYKAALGALRSAESAVTASGNMLLLYGMAGAEIDELVGTGKVHPRFEVRAPLGGRVVQREATLGEIVGPGRDALMVLADMKILWVLADVPENRIRQVGLDAPATVSIEALGGQNYTGKVSYIAPELDRETRTVQVRVEIKDGETPVKPGMFAQVHLDLGPTDGLTHAMALTVPETAVQSFEGGQAVFVAVASEPGTFAARQIKTGPANGRMVAIESGLEEGTPVVVDGAFVIKAELAKGIMEGKTCSGH